MSKIKRLLHVLEDIDAGDSAYGVHALEYKRKIRKALAAYRGQRPAIDDLLLIDVRPTDVIESGTYDEKVVRALKFDDWNPTCSRCRQTIILGHEAAIIWLNDGHASLYFCKSCVHSAPKGMPS